MFNDELYKELEQHYGVERMIDFAEIMTTRYDFLCSDIIDGGFSEDIIEKDWWFNKYVELKTLPEDRIIKDSLNKVDYCIVKLQEDLLDSITCLEKLKAITKEIGYNPSEM